MALNSLSPAQFELEVAVTVLLHPRVVKSSGPSFHLIQYQSTNIHRSEREQDPRVPSLGAGEHTQTTPSLRVDADSPETGPWRDTLVRRGVCHI